MAENIDRAFFLKQIGQRFIFPIVLVLLLIFAVNFIYRAFNSEGAGRFLLVLAAVILTLYYFIKLIKRSFSKLNQRITEIIPQRTRVLIKIAILFILVVLSTFLMIRMFMDWTFNWSDSFFFSFLILFELITRYRNKKNSLT